MKKYTLLLLFIIFSFKMYACKCAKQNIENDYIQSDFVAKIKILKKYPNIENSDYYKADIQILDLYKGNVSESIFIYGNYEESQNSACWIYTEVNENLIVYANKTNENYQLEMCSRKLRINEETNSKITNERHQKEIRILKILKLNKIKFTNNIKFTTSGFHTIRRENYGVKLKKEFAIYELTFNEDLSVKCVKKIQGFRNKIDRKIKSFLKTSSWSIYNKNKIKQNCKTLIVIYYKMNEEKNKGYITDLF